MRLVRNLGKFLLLLIMFVGVQIKLYSQELKSEYTLEEFIKLAEKLSLVSIEARNEYISSCYTYQDFKTGYLPSVSLSTTIPNFNRSISWNDDLQSFIEKNNVSSTANLSMSQKVAPMGGTLTMSSNLQQIVLLGDDGSTTYFSSPLSLSYSQPIFAINSMKWERKVSPIEFEKAKRTYVSSIEDNSVTAIRRFFSFISKQNTLDMARFNYSNLDTLYQMTKERCTYGAVSEIDLLKMQELLLNAKERLINAELNFKSENNSMMDFLGLSSHFSFKLMVPDRPNAPDVNFDDVLEKAIQYNPGSLSRELNILKAKKELIQAKKERFSMDLSITYGLDHSSASSLAALYEPPYSDRQQVSLGLSVPIVNWGQQNRKVKLAQAKEELAQEVYEREERKFVQEVDMQVQKYNAHKSILDLTSLLDSIAIKKFTMSKERFKIGKISVRELNDALIEKDNANARYLTNLKNYWIYFFSMRQLTLYDFNKDRPLLEVYEEYLKP